MQITDMMREYLRVGGDDSDDDDETALLPVVARKRNDIDELDTLTSRLNLSEDKEQVEIHTRSLTTGYRITAPT